MSVYTRTCSSLEQAQKEVAALAAAGKWTSEIVEVIYNFNKVWQYQAEV